MAPFCQELEELVSKWRAAVEQIKLLLVGITKAGQTLKSHVENIDRRVAREAKKIEKTQEAAVFARVKTQAKEAAQKLKDSEGKVKSIFTVDLAEVTTAGHIKEHEATYIPEGLFFKSNLNQNLMCVCVCW